MAPPVALVRFDEALDRVVVGLERKSRLINPRETEIVAHHEAGHALVAELRSHADHVHKISITPGASPGSTRLARTSRTGRRAAEPGRRSITHGNGARLFTLG